MIIIISIIMIITTTIIIILSVAAYIMTGGPLQYFINNSSISVYVESRVLLQAGC